MELGDLRFGNIPPREPSVLWKLELDPFGSSMADVESLYPHFVKIRSKANHLSASLRDKQYVLVPLNLNVNIGSRRILVTCNLISAIAQSEQVDITHNVGYQSPCLQRQGTSKCASGVGPIVVVP